MPRSIYNRILPLGYRDDHDGGYGVLRDRDQSREAIAMPGEASVFEAHPSSRIWLPPTATMQGTELAPDLGVFRPL